MAKAVPVGTGAVTVGSRGRDMRDGGLSAVCNRPPRLYILWAVLTLGCTYREQAPRLAEAHKVYVPYCTSDAHLGDAEAFGMQVNM